MLYSVIVFSMMLASGSAFNMPKAPSRMGVSSTKMADPWNAEAVGTNYIDIETLK